MKLPFRNIRINKTWIVLVVALGIGLVAAMAARSYLSGQMAAIEARSKGAQVAVVVAKRVLKKGEMLSADTVAVRSVPVDFAHSSALRPEEFDRFKGQALSHGANAGEMVLWSMLEGKKSPTFSAKVEAGHRAITVAVDEINSISGLLEPGDRVDLLVTVDQKGAKYTLVLLQSALVMATGQRGVDDPKSGERRHYSTVTLDTTPEQAHNIIVARETGRITALLRNPADQTRLTGGEFDLATLLGRKGEDLKPAEPSARQVPVLYGGRGGKLSTEGLQMGSPAGWGAGTHAPSPANPQASDGVDTPESADARALGGSRLKAAAHKP